MVDFQTKALDHFQEQKAKIEKIREEEEKKKKIKDLGDGKVEFTDSLGRTRIVNKGDVKDLMVSERQRFSQRSKILRGPPTRMSSPADSRSNCYAIESPKSTNGFPSPFPPTSLATFLPTLLPPSSLAGNGQRA